MRTRLRRRDRGSASAELVTITVPVAVILMLVMVLAGRGVTARMDVNNAVAGAARAASLQRSADAAYTAAVDTATAGLAGRCASRTVDVDTSDFQPGGTVTVTVTCVVDLSDLAAANVPGTTVLHASATSPVDRWRSTP